MKENKAKFTRLHSHELSFRASHVKSLKSFFKAHLKLSLVFIFSFSLLFPIFSESYSYSSNVESENKLFSQISVAYKNNFYIGTVSSADEFIEKFRDSVYLPEVLFYKAESLVNLENYSEAQKTLKDVLSLFKTGDAIFARGVFLLGKIKFAEKKYENALFYFSKIPSLLVGEAEGLKDIESQTILLTAQSLYFLKEYEKSIPYFELIISSGENYSLEEYMHSLSFLFLGYAECRKFNEMTKLFETFPEDYFDDDFYFQISLFVAQAYEELLEYKKAFALYSKILEGDRGTKAVIALKKAYLISEKYDVGIEQNVFFAEAIDNLQNAEEIVEEFYLRLGIDEFNSKNYQTAVSYFDSIKSDISESQNARVGNLYKAKILMEQNNYKEAFNILSSLQKIEDFDSDSVNATLLICNYNLKDDYSLYSQIPEIFAKIENPDYKSKYILSAFYYENGEYDKVLPEVSSLYASALCKQKKYLEASRVYADLEKSSLILSEDYSEYAKALFLTKNYKAAYEKSLKSTDKDKDFLSALCAINMGDWTSAKNHFYSYIKNQSGKSDFNYLCFYYKGIAEFSLGENKDAYSSFVRYISESKNASYILNAERYAAQCALLNQDKKNAFLHAQRLLEKSSEEKEKESAVIFLYEIYLDFKDYNSAESLLLSYKNGTSDFNAQIKLYLAELYQRQGKLSLADNEFQNIMTVHQKSVYAENASYRDAQMYYSAEDFSSALSRFVSYLYSFSNGTYMEEALYYAGECAYKTGELERCIMYCNALLQNNENSLFAFSAGSNLLNAYYEKADYNLALDVAKKLIEKFPAESRSFGIVKKAGEIELIVNGAQSAIVEKKSEYEQNGGEGTLQGRIAGTQLVQLYAQNPLTAEEAFNLAKKILQRQNSQSESSYAAVNAEVIADYYRADNENSLAAEYYLKAASSYRTSREDTKAASVLYSATESFIADGALADARQTSELLKELYPESRYAKRVDSLLKWF